MTAESAVYYDRQGRSISRQEWAELVAATLPIRRNVVDGVTVETLYLGVSLTQPLTIFQTSVAGGPLNGRVARYATETEAVAGHHAVLAEVIAVKHIQGGR